MNAVISTNESAWILTGHVTFKLSYNRIYQMKTPNNKFWTKYVNPFYQENSITMEVVNSIM